jgi:hypothetical protein
MAVNMAAVVMHLVAVVVVIVVMVMVVMVVVVVMVAMVVMMMVMAVMVVAVVVVEVVVAISVRIQTAAIGGRADAMEMWMRNHRKDTPACSWHPCWGGKTW